MKVVRRQAGGPRDLVERATRIPVIEKEITSGNQPPLQLLPYGHPMMFQFSELMSQPCLYANEFFSE